MWSRVGTGFGWLLLGAIVLTALGTCASLVVYAGLRTVDELKGMTVQSEWTHARVRAAGADILAGLTKHRAETGRLPSALGELVPRYLPSSPEPIPGTTGWEYTTDGDTFSLSCRSAARPSEMFLFESRDGRWYHLKP